jgi:hypothetical protein
MKAKVFTYFIEIQSGNFLNITKKWSGFRDINELNRPGFKVIIAPAEISNTPF